MLGDIIRDLTDATAAESILTAVAAPALLERIRERAEEEGVAVGPLVASKVRHLIDHGGEELWLDLMGVMSATPQPAAAAVERLLVSAFPDPVRVRLTRRGTQRLAARVRPSGASS